MKALVTGAAGFAGSHLVDSLLEQGHEVAACGLAPQGGAALPPNVTWVELDVTDAQACWNVLADQRPDAVYHLAGVAHVSQAEADPERALAVNFGGTRNMLESCLDGFVNTRFLLASSAEVYGRVPTEQQPVREDHPLAPGTAYALSKAAAEMAVHHAVARGLHAVVARPFNHIGPRQSDDFVASAFAHQVARIEAGEQDPVLEVGNLEAVRDLSDVRDIVRGYQEVLRVGQPGEVFNLTSGGAVRIADLLDTLLELSSATIEVRTDPARMRPLDVPVFHGSGTRLEERCGFVAPLDLKRTLGDVLDYWRASVSRNLAR
ncbi:MAG: GDP-mannose 4,6-dehydratase [Planctomycetota bacterium]|nr:MAG: GDP-mannose 4,6-dehydratase [Planctomycetota bacterium]